MKKQIGLLFFLLAGITIQAQNYQRYEDESAEDFIQRIMPEEKSLIHPAIEAKWNNTDKKVIIAFWHEREQVDKDYKVTYTIGKLYVPVDDVGSYEEIEIDRVSENPMEAEIQSVFFDDADGDGKRELIVLYSWNYRHYQMAGTFYAAYVYDDINYDKLPSELTVIDIIDGGTDGNNDTGEIMTPIFTTAGEVKTYLNKRGRKPNKSFFRKNLAGKIGKNMDVAFYIERDGEHLGGFYYYKSRGFDIRIYGEIKNDIAELKETDGDGNTTATITGTFSDTGFNGTWKSAKTGKTYPVDLKLLDYNIDYQPYIEGNYTSVTGCNMTISIKKEKQEYTYTLEIGDKKETGSVSLNRSRESNQNVIYINFEDVIWADYKGSLMDVENPDDVPSTEMRGLDGFWTDNKILIQNYGNAMNYYVKLKDCDSKFIELERNK